LIDKVTVSLFALSAIITYLIRDPWIFPVVLVLGGAVGIISSKEKNLWNRVNLQPPWIYLGTFIAIAIGTIILTMLWDIKILKIFESFYRYGYLVFGGGQVVVPVMYSELVEINQYMTSQEFLTGYGLVQGLPGPMFSFSAYAGGMAMRDNGTFWQVLAAAAGGIGIFLPGLLLIYFVYPVWENMKKIRGIKVSLKGINAVAGGLITVSAIILMNKNGYELDYVAVTILTIILLYLKKIPAPLIVIGVLLLGFVI
ncbi:MAG: chromate transporter, partial [Tissierellales bacterium]|nr:chromate transporter [Tissierellales bacterium]